MKALKTIGKFILGAIMTACICIMGGERIETYPVATASVWRVVSFLVFFVCAYLLREKKHGEA